MLDDAQIEAVIPVSDVDQALSFYEGIGLKRLERFDDIPENPMVRLEAGSGTVTIYKSVGAGQSRHTIANFIVPDVDAAVARLRDRGVTFDEYDVPNIKTDGGIATVGRVRGAWFKDADGNIISVGSYGQ